MMTPQDRQTITAWGQSHRDEMRIEVLARKDAPSLLLSEFCDALFSLVPHITVHQRRLRTDEALPAIRITERIQYHALPTGLELSPFLSALAGDTAWYELPPDVQEALAEMEIPARFRVFISSQCPFCPETVRKLIAISSVAPRMRLSIIDAGLFGAEAAKNDVRSVPTVVLDDQFRWTGSVNPVELANVMLNRDAAQLSAQSLLGIIEEGKSNLVVQLMVNAGKLFPAIFELLADEKWPIRLGAMVTIEGIGAEAPDLAQKAVSQLRRMLPDVTEPVQGDLLYLMGEIGGSSVVSDLLAYQAPPHSTAVREAAADAIAGILARDEKARLER